jgi:hypothetical protein
MDNAQNLWVVVFIAMQTARTVTESLQVNGSDKRLKESDWHGNMFFEYCP